MSRIDLSLRISQVVVISVVIVIYHYVFLSQVVVRLSHPAAMELVLRKRISINVYKRQSITDKLKKRIGKAVSILSGCISLLAVRVAPVAQPVLFRWSRAANKEMLP